MAAAVLLLGAIAMATDAAAQNRPGDDEPPPGAKPPASGTASKPDERPPVPPAADGDWVSREELKEAVDEAVRKRIEKERRQGGLLSSDSGLGLWVGGGLEAEYRGVQENRRPGTLPPRQRAQYGLGFDKAWLFIEGSWDDQSSKSEFEIARGRVSLEATADDAVMDEAWVWFNRPLTRFSIPVFKVYGADSLMVGLADPFWKNQHRIGEQYSLHQESFARDERLQVTYTLGIMQTGYVIAGLSGGTQLALAGDIDESGNYPILQDDREGYWANQSTPGAVRRSPEFSWGFGIVIPTAKVERDAEKVIHPKRQFWPSMVTSHRDVIHFGMWGVTGGLSPGERALVDSAAGGPTSSLRRWRYGAVLDAIQGFGDHVGYLRAEAGQAADGVLRRDFASLEAAMAFHTSVAVPMLRTVTPFARYSLMTANLARVAADNTTVAGSAAEQGAWATADRYQFTAGVRLGIHEYMAVVFEYTWNGERLGLASDEVDNDLWMLSLRVSF